jgi:protein-tyrosine phosphatase
MMQAEIDLPWIMNLTASEDSACSWRMVSAGKKDALPVAQPNERSRCALFLCSGNFYRSRFAELLFNFLAEQAGLSWIADSRALDVERGRPYNIGPISLHAVKGLEERGIVLPPDLRFPMQVREDDLERAAMIIALKEAEHRRLIEAAFARWAQRVEYWDIDDLDKSAPREALAEIEIRVRQLVDRLRHGA